MALLSGFDELDSATDTFSAWLNKTNELILLTRGDTVSGQTSFMTANSLPGGSMTYGNSTLFGQFAANAMVVFNNGGDSANTLDDVAYGGLRGGIWNPASNTITGDWLYVVSNTEFTTETVEVYVNSSYGLIVENFIEARHDVLFVGNTGANTDAQLHWQDNNNTLNWNEEVRAIFGGNTGTDALSVYGGTDQYEMFYLDGRMYTNTDIQDIRSSANLNVITDVLEIRSETGGELYLTANVNNGVELYWDNSLKLSTNTHGIVVHGDSIVRDNVVVFDNNKILMGGAYPYNGGEDIATYNFQIYTDGTDGIIVSGDKDLNIFVHEGFNLTNEPGTVNFMTANADGSSEVVLYNNGTARLETTGTQAGEVPGVEIFGEANTTTLRVRGDANFDGFGGLNSNNVHWDASANTWNYRDNTNITLGDQDDWVMYYNGTRAYSNVDNQDIRARTDMNVITNTFELKSETGSELYMSANVADNSTVRLYYEGVERLQTNTHGVEVTGQLVANGGIVVYNNQSIEMGGADYANAHNFTIVTDGTDTTITETSNDLFVRVQDNFRVTDDTGATSAIVANTSGEVTLYHNGVATLETTGNETGEVQGIEVFGQSNTTTLRVRTDVNFDGSTGLNSNNISWDASANTLYMRDNSPIIIGDGNDLTIKHDGSNTYITEANTGNLLIEATDLILRATDSSRYLEGIDGSHVIIYSPDNTPALLANNNQVHITDLANTNTLRVRNTSLFENDISIEGSNSTNTLTWDKSANTLNLDDNNFITFGTSGEFSIHHNASGDTILQHATASPIYLQADDVLIQSNDGNTDYIRSGTGSTYSGVILYSNNIQRFETTLIGVNIEGQANTDTLRVQSTALMENDVFFDGTSADQLHWDASQNELHFKDSVEAIFGTDDDLIVVHTGSAARIDNITGNLRLRSNDLRLGSITGDEAYATATLNGAIVLYHNNVHKLTTTSTGVTANGLLTSDSLDVNGNADLGASASDTVSIIGSVDTHIIPTGTRDLGNSANSWSKLWVVDADIQTLQVDLNATINGEVTANNFVGDGAQLTDLHATEITTGTLSDARLPDTITSDITGTAAQANDILIQTSTNNADFRIPWVDTSGTYRNVYTDNNFVYNPSTDTATVPNLIVTTTVSLPADIAFSNTTSFENINVSNTANILNLEVTSLEANGVAFTGTGGDVTTTSATTIDSFPIGQTQGYKYFVHGETSNVAHPEAGYAVEINVIVTDESPPNIYYTRYGEVENAMSDVDIVPSLAANNTHIDLKATCGSASVANTHVFKVLKIETRT